MEAVDLRALIGPAGALPASASVEAAQAEFARSNTDFLAVLDGDTLLGLCARRELAHALGSRYGFALNARRPVREHLMAHPLRVSVGTPVTEVFKAASARAAGNFYDDVLLVDESGRYVGLIPMHTLVRLQTEFLLGNITRLEASRQEIADKNRQMQEDLDMAREVQLAMLPQADSTWADSTGGVMLRVAHCYRPASGVSGDFFDVLRLERGETGLLVCDVMGHGVRPALITAMVRAMVEELRPIAADPGRLLTRLNADLTRLLRRTGSLIFVTAGYAVIDAGGERLRYAQAGHPAPLIYAAQRRSARPLAVVPGAAGPALGLFDDFEFAASEERVAPGDRLLLFTDGLTEARNAAGEEFAIGRLAAALAASAGESLATTVSNLLAAAKSFCSDTAFGDDICLVAAAIGHADRGKS